MKIKSNGVELEFETYGRKSDPTVLLIMGLGAQLTLWPEALCLKLADKGFHVVLYDNRDVGLSSKFDAAGLPDIAAIVSGSTPPAYTLDDMAADAAGLLGALGVARAHIVGASMGGMIAQLVASNHPDKTLSLTSIMSTTGNPAVPPASPEAMAALTNRLPVDTPVEELINNSVRTLGVIGSPAHNYDTPAERDRIRKGMERSLYPAGFARQMAAIVANGDRRSKIKSITAPCAVVHGEVDPLVNLEGGRDTAANIEGAELVIVSGMGHDLPPFVIDEVVAVIERTAARASVRA